MSLSLYLCLSVSLSSSVSLYLSLWLSLFFQDSTVQKYTNEMFKANGEPRMANPDLASMSIRMLYHWPVLASKVSEEVQPEQISGLTAVHISPSHFRAVKRPLKTNMRTHGRSYTAPIQISERSDDR